MGRRRFLTVRKRKFNAHIQSKLKRKVIKQPKAITINLDPSDYISVDLEPPTWISTYQYIDPPSVSSLPKDFEVPSGCSHPLPVSGVDLEEGSIPVVPDDPSTSFQDLHQHGDDQASSDICHDQSSDYHQYSDHQASSDICHDQPPLYYQQCDHQASSDVSHHQPPLDCQQHDHEASTDISHHQPPLDSHQHDHEASTDVIHHQPPLDCQQHDHEASTDISHHQPPLDSHQHGDHPASSCVYNDHPPLEYHQQHTHQAISDVSHNQLLFQQTRWYNQIQRCTTIECTQPGAGSHLNDDIFSYLQCHGMDNTLHHTQTSFYDQQQLVSVHNPQIYSEQQQPSLDYISLLRLKSSLLKAMTSFKNWFVLPTDSVSKIQCCTYGINAAVSPVITFTIEIFATHEWQLRIPSGILPKKNYILQLLPVFLRSVHEVKQVTDTIDSCKICKGIYDEKYEPLIEKRKGRFYDFSGKKLVALYDHYFNCVRHVDCVRLMLMCRIVDQCEHCYKFQRNVLNAALRGIHQGISPNRSGAQSHTNYRYCNTPEKCARLADLHHILRVESRALQRLRSQIDKHIESAGLQVDKTIDGDLEEVMNKQTQNVFTKHGEDSFLAIFWKQQLKVSACSKATGKRWHPLMIKWELYLHHISSKAYNTIRNSGIISLPSTRTLREYTHLSPTKLGFSIDADRQLLDLLNVKDDLAKYGLILIDEMYVKQGVVFEKSTGAMIGLTDLGEVTNQLNEFEYNLKCGSDKLHRPVAKCMMVFMFKGLFTNIALPFAHFPVSAVKGYDIFPLLWEAIGRLQRIGCVILGITCDGATPNRKLFHLHCKPGDTNGDTVYKTTNVFSNEGKEIFFFVDPPHLIKTVRNSFANPVRNLWCNGKDIKWQFIKELYARNAGRPGLSLAHKIRFEHVHLTNFSKMRVDLAAQVLSSTVANELQLNGGPEATETATFVDLMDKFFDCFNVLSLSKGKLQRKPFQQPYRKVTDFRLKFLKEEFLLYLKKWEDSVMARNGFSDPQKEMMMIAKESRTGLQISVQSLLELIPTVLSIPGVGCFLSGHISQDPLEKYFGMQRQKGKSNDNPTVLEFVKNNETIRLVGTMWFDDPKGNCRKSQAIQQSIADTKLLPLRKRKRRSSI